MQNGTWGGKGKVWYLDSIGMEPGMPPPNVSAAVVREQLRRICESRGFASAESLRRFLSFVIEKSLQGRGQEIKEYLIGVEVFDRGEQFDPRIDSIVRVQGTKLRSKLREYYDGAGLADSIRIELPRGSYVPVFTVTPRPDELARTTGETTPSGASRIVQQRRMPLLGLILTVAGVAVCVWLLRRPAEIPQPTLVCLSYDTGLTIDPAISPDGKLLAYASDRSGDSNLDIWVQATNGGAPLQITHFSGDEREPVFSPDGTRLAFSARHEGDGIYVTSVFGGEARRIAPSGRRPRFSPDGSLIAYWVGTDVFGEIYIVPASGGAGRRVRPEFNHATYPVWTPDGKHLLFFGNNSNLFDPDWWITDLQGTSLQRTGLWNVILRDHHLEVDPRLFGDWIWFKKYLIFSARQGDSVNLWRIPLSPVSGHASGHPQRLTFGAGQDVLPSIAADNHLVFANIRNKVQVWTLPIRADEGRATGKLSQLTSDAASDVWPYVSRDGRKVVFASNRGGEWQIWLRDMETGQERLLTAPPIRGIVPALTADGSKVAFGPPFPRAGENVGLYVVDSAGGVPERVCARCGYPSGWSRDKQKLFYTLSPQGNPNWLDLGSGQSHPFLSEKAYSIWNPVFSPDDRWVAFEARDNRDCHVFVVPFLDGAPPKRSSWLPITTKGRTNRTPAWSIDGGLLYFQSDRDGFPCIWAVRLDRDTKRPNGEPFAVLHLHTTRLSPGNLKFNEFRLSVSNDNLVFNLAELTGNIWMTNLQP
jgi:Tol biopolymer transport system component